MNRCPICNSPINTEKNTILQKYEDTEEYYWVDDPILTNLGLAGKSYRGSTPIRGIHIIELQQARNEIENGLGLDPTNFLVVNKREPIRAAHILQLRFSTERILKELGLTLEDYFNYDLQGNEIRTIHQVYWTDPNLQAGTPIKAIHIEDLRHQIRVGKGLIESYITSYADPSETPYGPTLYSPLNSKITLGGENADVAGKLTWRQEGIHYCDCGPGGKNRPTYIRDEYFGGCSDPWIYEWSGPGNDGLNPGCYECATYLWMHYYTYQSYFSKYSRFKYYRRYFLGRCEAYLPKYLRKILGDSITLKEAILPDDESGFDIPNFYIPPFLEDLSWTGSTITLNFEREDTELREYPVAIYSVNPPNKSVRVTYEKSSIQDYNDSTYIGLNQCCQRFPSDWGRLTDSERAKKYPQYFILFSHGKRSIWVPSLYFTEEGNLSHSRSNRYIAVINSTPLEGNRYLVTGTTELISKDSGVIWFASEHYTIDDVISGNSISLEGKPLLQFFTLTINDKQWTRVDNLNLYGPSSTVFKLDVDGKAIIFGNGSGTEGHGAQPSGTYHLDYYADEIEVVSWDSRTVTLAEPPKSGDWGFCYINTYAVDVTDSGDDPIYSRPGIGRTHVIAYETYSQSDGTYYVSPNSEYDNFGCMAP